MIVADTDVIIDFLRGADALAGRVALELELEHEHEHEHEHELGTTIVFRAGP